MIAIPVVDASDMLLGIITHDDAMDILRQEQTEDMLAFGGVSRNAEANDEPYWQGRIVEGVRRRIFWLLLLFVGGTITSWFSHHFNWVDDRFHEIDFDALVPLLIGTGGNAGSQTVGTIIRGTRSRRDSAAGICRAFSRASGSPACCWACCSACSVSVFTWILLRRVGSLRGGDRRWRSWASACGPTASEPWSRWRPSAWESTRAVVSAPLISTLVDATGLVSSTRSPSCC